MIAIIVQITAKADSIDTLLDALAENARHSNEEPGCQQWQYSRHLKEPNCFAIYEVYDDQDAVDAHMSSEHFKRWFAIAPTLWESKESARYEIL